MSFSIRMMDISVFFHNKRVIQGINVDLLQSGISVIAGKSGSGKTTMLRSINRLNEEFVGCVTEGCVEADIGDGLESIYPVLPKKYSLSKLRRCIGMVFQTPNVFPVSIYKNIALPLSQLTACARTEVPDRVRLALEKVGLLKEVQSRLDDPAIHLSGGQKQRLCLARMLALEPHILLLDEPTASLDTHATQGIEHLLVQLSEKYTIVMVSHNIPQIARLAQHLIVIEDGYIKHTKYNSTYLERDIVMLFDDYCL